VVKEKCQIAIATLVVAWSAVLHAQVSAGMTIPVTPDNFDRAESDMYFSSTVKNGGFGKFHHNREVMPIDKQAVIRANRDTLYSAAIFDVDAGPVTVTMPDAGNRFMSMMVIDEDQYAPLVFYGAGARTLTKQQIGTRYVMVGIRTFVDPNAVKDIEQVHALQDAFFGIDRRNASPGACRQDLQAAEWQQFAGF
jgi:hypothetical protein